MVSPLICLMLERGGWRLTVNYVVRLFESSTGSRQ